MKEGRKDYEGRIMKEGRKAYEGKIVKEGLRRKDYEGKGKDGV